MKITNREKIAVYSQINGERTFTVYRVDAQIDAFDFFTEYEVEEIGNVTFFADTFDEVRNWIDEETNGEKQIKDALDTEDDYYNYLNRRIPEELETDISRKYVDAVAQHFFDMKYDEQTVIDLWDALLKYGNYREEQWK